MKRHKVQLLMHKLDFKNLTYSKNMHQNGIYIRIKEEKDIFVPYCRQVDVYMHNNP